MPERQLATIEIITDIADIPDADNILRARVRGWDVVVKKGEFSVGDLCVYFEIDSMLDVEDERFAFLAPRGVRTDAGGNKGHVLKTARLRGQYSQGLVLPLSEFPEVEGIEKYSEAPGCDLTELLGIRKWDPPVPACLSGQIKGMRPSWIPRTDEERIQNVPEVLGLREHRWLATEKIDGSSCSVYKEGEGEWLLTGVCSRNLDLIEEERNTLWALARRLDLHTQMIVEWPGLRVAIQGEAFGEGIQGNPLQMKGQHFAAFAVVIEGRLLPRPQWPDWVLDNTVPVLPLAFPGSLREALEQADRRSLISSGRPAEGVVWNAIDTECISVQGTTNARPSFKVVSNRYLLKNDV